MEKEQSLYHGTSFHRACQIIESRTLIGKIREEGKNQYVSLSEELLIGFWFGDIVFEFPGLKPQAKKIEYVNEEWLRENPDLCDYVLDGVSEEDMGQAGIISMSIEKEFVISEQFSFDLKDIIIHIGNEDVGISKGYETHIRNVFGHHLTIIVDDLYYEKSQRVACAS